MDGDRGGAAGGGLCRGDGDEGRTSEDRLTGGGAGGGEAGEAPGCGGEGNGEGEGGGGVPEGGSDPAEQQRMGMI